MSPAKSKGAPKDKPNPETSSNISTAVSETSEKSQKRTRGKKGEKVEENKKVEKTVDDKVEKEVAKAEEKETENGVATSDAVAEEDKSISKEGEKTESDDKMEVAEEENKPEKGKNGKKAQAKKAKASKTNKKEHVVTGKEEDDDKVDEAAKEADDEKESEKEPTEEKMEVEEAEEKEKVIAKKGNAKKAAASAKMTKKAAAKENKANQKKNKEAHPADGGDEEDDEDKVPSDDKDKDKEVVEEKMEVDGETEEKEEVEAKKSNAKKTANAKVTKKAAKENKMNQKEEEEKVEEKKDEKEEEVEKPTRGKKRGKAAAEKEDEKKVEEQSNSRQTRQKKTEEEVEVEVKKKKTETPNKKNAKSAKEDKKAEAPKGKRGSKVVAAAVEDEEGEEEKKEEEEKEKEPKKSIKDDKKTSVAKKAINAKNSGKAKEEVKEKEVVAVANSKKRKAESDADKQANKKGKFQLEVPSEPLRHKVPGHVFSMGESDVGQLGLGPDVMEMSKPKKVDLSGDKIVQVSAGGMHSLCVTEKGEIYSFGCNDEATLGRVTEEEDDCAVPKKVEGIEGKVVQAIAGDSHSVALTEEGQVYIWGTFRDTNGVIGINPGEEEDAEEGKQQSGKRKQENGKEMGKSEKVEKPSKILHGLKVTKIAGGSAHILCLTDKGEIYSLGASDLGQLGRCGGWFSIRGGRLGLDSTLNAKPVRFAKRGIKCVDIWAGAYESFAKSSEGEILSWGLNNYHQLGFSDKESRMFPEVATTFDPALDWKEIACAEHHTIALDGSGRVHCIGRKDYGRLGLGSLESIDHVDKLTPIGSLEKKKCTSVGCGTSVSFAVADDGTIYGWGMGSTKQLGTGDDEDDILEPTPIKGKQLENMRGIMAVAGGQHTLLLALEKS